MPVAHIVRRSDIVNTFRVAKVQGMFDIPRRDVSVFERDVAVPIEGREWQVGLVTGASGTGKSTLADELWGLTPPAEWKAASLVDDFPEHMTPKDITGLLASVGLSSSPTWLLPYAALSTGQRFRADLARALADNPGGLVVFDEFTSTVDRTVAKSSSVALGKHIRRAGGQFIAVTCHRDITEWLQPDWVLDTDTYEFTWGSVQPRPKVTVRIEAGSRAAWSMFRHHHYLTGDLSPAARVFLAWAELGDEPERLVGFFSVLPQMGHKGWRRGHRTVVLPDFQGLGIGNRMIEATAEALWVKEGLRFGATTSAPSIVHHRLRHPEMWRLVQGPTMKAPQGRTGYRSKSGSRVVTSAGRLTTSWAYIPTELRSASSPTPTASPTR